MHTSVTWLGFAHAVCSISAGHLESTTAWPDTEATFSQGKSKRAHVLPACIYPEG